MTSNDLRFYMLPVEIAKRRDVPPAAKVVLSVLVTRIGDNGMCWPGVRRIALDTGMNRKTVMRSIKLLDSLGIISIRKNGNGRLNYYQIAELNRSQGDTGPKIGPVPECPINRSQNVPTGPKMSPEAVPECPQKRTIEKNKEKISKKNKGIHRKKPQELPTIDELLAEYSALDNPAFRQIWADWLMFRIEIKKKLTPLMIKRQMKLMAENPENAVAMIDASIRNGWQGLFPINNPAPTGKSSNFNPASNNGIKFDYNSKTQH